MKTCLKTLTVTALLALTIPAWAESEPDDAEALRIAAVEALISAPADRALPLARKVVEGNYSDDLKERALFVLSQIDEPEAQGLIAQIARNSSGELQEEAIRMIGISGNSDAMTQLRTLFVEGDEDVREAVIEAYIIADDEDSVFQLALETQDEEAFAELVEALGVMGARDKLSQLRDQVDLDKSGISDALIEAYAISGDLESLRVIALDTSDPEQQTKAIEGIGIVGSKAADQALLDIYRSADNEEVREAAIEGLMISGNDEALLELYRASNSAAEKRVLLEYLIDLGSDEIWQVIDQALEEGQ